MTKSCLVDFKIQQKGCFRVYRKLYFLTFPETVWFEDPSWIICAYKKIKMGKFWDKGKFFTGFISGLHDFMPYFHFLCVAHANLIHSADVCSLVMVCVGYTCAHAAKNSQNSFTFASVFLPKCIFIRQQQKVNTIPNPGKKLCVMSGLMMRNCKCVNVLSLKNAWLPKSSFWIPRVLHIVLDRQNYPCIYRKCHP